MAFLFRIRDASSVVYVEFSSFYTRNEIQITFKRKNPHLLCKSATFIYVLKIQSSCAEHSGRGYGKKSVFWLLLSVIKLLNEILEVFYHVYVVAVSTFS